MASSRQGSSRKESIPMNAEPHRSTVWRHRRQARIAAQAIASGLPQAASTNSKITTAERLEAEARHTHPLAQQPDYATRGMPGHDACREFADLWRRFSQYPPRDPAKLAALCPDAQATR